MVDWSSQGHMTYPLLMYMSADFMPGNETMLIYANLGFGMGREIY